MNKHFTIYKSSSHIAEEYLKLIKQDVEREKTQGQSLVSNNMYPNTYNVLEWVSDKSMIKIITVLAKMFVTYQEGVAKHNAVFIPNFDVIGEYIKRHNKVYWEILPNPEPPSLFGISLNFDWNVYVRNWDMRNTSTCDKQMMVKLAYRYFHNISSFTSTPNEHGVTKDIHDKAWSMEQNPIPEKEWKIVQDSMQELERCELLRVRIRQDISGLIQDVVGYSVFLIDPNAFNNNDLRWMGWYTRLDNNLKNADLVDYKIIALLKLLEDARRQEVLNRKDLNNEETNEIDN